MYLLNNLYGATDFQKIVCPVGTAIYNPRLIFRICILSRDIGSCRSESKSFFGIYKGRIYRSRTARLDRLVEKY